MSRNKSDTYYVSEDRVLRTHTSAHQTELMREGKKAFLCTGDVYRRDEIDSSHYPVFHQMEGVKIFEPSELPNPENPTDGSNVKYIEDDLKDHLEGMVQALFGPNIETRCHYKIVTPLTISIKPVCTRIYFMSHEIMVFILFYNIIFVYILQDHRTLMIFQYTV